MKDKPETIADLKPAPYNPRRITADALRALGRSLGEFGDISGLVWNQRTGHLVAGHQRLAALRAEHGDALKLEGGFILTPSGERFPVRVVDWPPAKEKAANVAANSPLLAGDFTPDLGPLLKELKIELPDLTESLRLDNIVIPDLIESATAGLTDPDDVPDAPEKPNSETGDLWLLGEHRLLCGDCTKAADVARLMAGEKAGLCFTSPPYLQQRDYTEASDCSDWDGLMQGVFGNLDAAMAEDGQVLVNLGLIHRNCEWVPYWDVWIQWMREQGWRRFGWYVWDQGPGLPGDWGGRFAPSHEFVFHFNRESVRPAKTVPCKHAGLVREGGMRRRDGTTGEWSHAGIPVTDHRIPDSVIRISREKASQKYGHPAMFSVGFSAQVCQAWTGIVYDPFCGSGTTIIAAEQLDRRCYAIEIEPRYIDVAVRRWQKFTGKKARTESGKAMPGPVAP